MINDVEHDQDGNMLFTSHLGVFVYNGLHYENLTEKDGLAISSTYRTEVDEKGRIWFMAYSNKISYLENDTIRQLSAFNNSPYCGKSASRVFFVGEDRIVVDMMHSGVLLYYYCKKNKWYFEKKVLFDFQKRVPIIRYGKSIVWLDRENFRGNGLIKIQAENFLREFRPDDSGFTIFRFQYGKTSYLSIANYLFAFEGDQVRHASFDEALGPVYDGLNGTLWLSFVNGGFRKLRKKDLTLTGEHFLRDERITDLTQDLDGNVWMATNSGKLGMLPYSPYKKWSVGHSIIGIPNQIFALKDTLFLGHFNGDLGFFVPGKMTQERIVYTLLDHPDLIPSHVRGFVIFKDQFYFASLRNGLFRMNRKTYEVENVVADLPILGLYNNGEELYLATDNGLYSFNGVKARQLCSNEVGSVTITPEGQILLGQQDGLHTLRNGKSEPVKWPVKTEERVSDFARSKNKTVIAFFGAGLLIKEGNTFVAVRQADGLPSDFINDVFFNSRGQLVVATGNGIAILTFHTNSKKPYTIETISGNLCINHDTFFIAEIKNKLYFSSRGGLMEVPEIRQKKPGNPLTLRAIKLNGKDIESPTISFTYYQGSVLEINYRQNSFIQNEGSIYYYRLNKEQSWIRTRSESILLSDLAPGTYALELFAVHPYSGFRSEIIRKEIVVIPRFYQQVWFRILVALIMLLAAYTLLRFFLRKRENKRKKSLGIQLEISRLEARALRSQMNPHFVFNSLNSIQNFILKNDRDSAYKYLGKFSALVREILEHSRNEKISISDEIHMLKNYLDLEKMRADHRFTYSIEVDDRLAHKHIEIPIMLLQPLVENAVVHGVSPLEGRPGEISLIFRAMDAGMLEMIIRDNGIGRAAAELLNARKMKYHQSMGMDISKERTKNPYGIEQTSFFQVKDLYSAEGEAIGTEVIIRIQIT